MHFTATSCVLRDGIDIESQLQMEETMLPAEIVQRQVIQAQLRPGSLRDDGHYFRETTFSMFGTDRAIKSFQLDIHPIADPAEQESCRAWGSVSYTTEIDFRDEKVDDCIVFSLFVKPETFARYAVKIAHGSVDEIILSVKSVAGLYSEWSPSIFTRNVKVLTEGSEQNIAFPPGHQIELPRLGHVGAAELYINRRLEFSRQVREPEAIEETPEFGTVAGVPETQTPAVTDPWMLQMLGSLRWAAWFVVWLLVLIFIVTLLKR